MSVLEGELKGRARSHAICLAFGVVSGLALGYLAFSETTTGVPSKNQQNANILPETPGKEASWNGPPRQSDPRSPNERGTANPYGITDEDVAEERRLNEEKRSGFYALRFDSPVARKAQQAIDAGIVKEISASRAANLEAIFTELGLDELQRTQLRDHLDDIVRASLQAESAQAQLLVARRDYDRRLKEALSPEDYERYREYEQSQQAVREYNFLETYLRERGVDIDRLAASDLVNAIRETEAYTHQYWHGPYDGLPQPAVGEEPVKEILRREIQLTKEGMEKILPHISSDTFPEQYQKHIANYYAEKIARGEAALLRMDEPPRPPHLRGVPNATVSGE